MGKHTMTYEEKRKLALATGVAVHEECGKDINLLVEVVMREYANIVTKLDGEEDLLWLADKIHEHVVGAFNAIQPARVLKHGDSVADLVNENGPAIDTVDKSKKDEFADWLIYVGVFFRLINIYNYNLDTGIDIYM